MGKDEAVITFCNEVRSVATRYGVTDLKVALEVLSGDDLKFSFTGSLNVATPPEEAEGA